MQRRVFASIIVALTILMAASAAQGPAEAPPQREDGSLPDDLAFPTWTAFEELDLTVTLIIQTSPPEQRQQMLQILNATAESPQVPEARRERVAAIRERLTPLLER